MKYLLGIDVGTSSVKSLLIQTNGKIIAIGQKEYQFDIPRTGWAEQDPEVWWDAAVYTIHQVIKKSGIDVNDISCLGFAGQMHGVVALDKKGIPVRKAILWCDQRSRDEVDDINRIVGQDALGKIAHSPIATGFQLASLLWMKRHEPQLFEKINKVILPKDYIRYKLTGQIATDFTDAAPTLCFDCTNERWSQTLIETFGFNSEIFPEVFRSYELSEPVNEEAALITGLKKGTMVSFGGADQAMMAVGNGIIKPGNISVNIGTGGQIMAPLSSNIFDQKLRAHSFNFLFPSTWYYMGASLSSGLSLRWGRETIDKTLSYREIDDGCEKIQPCSEGLIFLPYLIGERTPHMDPNARGMFFGLTVKHTKYHLFRSIMEGVVFSLRDSLEILTKDFGQSCSSLVASGGGARSNLWMQIQADILQHDIKRTNMKEQAAVGAAITAGVAAGLYSSFEEAIELVVSWDEEIFSPNQNNFQLYDHCYEIYKMLYSNNKDAMEKIGRL